MEVLTAWNLDVNNMVGFGSDGANNVSGKLNSVWSRIKASNPSVIQIKCTCHSLDLCVAQAFDAMPSSVGYLLQEIPNHFNKSSLRRDAYTTLFSVMHPSGDYSVPSPFTKFSQTLWLARGKVLYNLKVNWEELKAYFMCALENAGSDVRYKLRTILQELNNERNLMYVIFLVPVIQEFERVNSKFQTSGEDGPIQDLVLLHKVLKARIFDTNGHRLKLENIDFGYCLDDALHKSKLDERQVHEVKVTCMSFLIKLNHEVEKRLPDNENIFKEI